MQNKTIDFIEYRLSYLKKSLFNIENSREKSIDVFFDGFMKGKNLSIKDEIDFLESIRGILNE